MTGTEHERVAVALLVAGQDVLLCRRSANCDRYPGLWGLPGGGARPAEAEADALVRELREELGIVAAVPAEPPLAVLREPRPGIDPRALFSVWLVTSWHGEPVNLAPGEHDAIEWVDLEHAAKFDGLLHPGYAALFARLLTC